MGTWALSQAQALSRLNGCSVEVLSMTPWLPRFPFSPAGYRAYANCPAIWNWDGVPVRYPRWPSYPLGPLFHVYHRDPAKWLSFAWIMVRRRVLRFAGEFSPDVVFAHHSGVNGLPAARIAASLRIPFVTQDHSYNDLKMCERFRRRRRYFAEIGAAAARMLAVSEKMAKGLRQIAPQAHVEVIYNGADSPWGATELVPAGQRGLTVFGVGMLIERKGFDYLIRAWAQVVRRFPDAKLRIAGDGPERAALERLRTQLGLDKSVELLGYVKHEEVLNEMAKARVFVLPSWHEPFGVVYTEAMAAGCAIVWSTEAGIAEVLCDETSGYGVPPRGTEELARALIRILADDAHADAIGVVNRGLSAERFTWDAVAARLAGVLRSSIASHERRGN